MTRDWLMYTEKGNKIIDSLVWHARHEGWTWPECLSRLYEVSQSGVEAAEPAFDTVVRERVYSALGYTTDFYADFKEVDNLAQ